VSRIKTGRTVSALLIFQTRNIGQLIASENHLGGLSVRFSSVLTLLVAILLSACASTGAVAPAGDRLAGHANFEEQYKLGVGDKVRITVYNEASLSGEFSVGSGGSLSLPLIGDVPVTGQTTEQVAAVVTSKLADGYVRDPKVSAEVTEYRPFYILGEIRSPGTYPYVVGLTALNAVATAQGFTPRANKSMVFIRRSGSDQEVAYELSPDLLIFPGDTVRVGERYF
jgi:polysaccharide export outer membrane protein